MNRGFQGAGNTFQVGMKQEISQFWHGREEQQTDQEDDYCELYKGKALASCAARTPLNKIAAQFYITWLRHSNAAFNKIASQFYITGSFLLPAFRVIHV